MGKDTVVIRSLVPSTTKQPFLSMPDNVKEYFSKNYGQCEPVFYTSSYQGQQTRYVVVLRFERGDVANRIKQKYNGRVLSGARVTTCWLDQKNMQELGITEDMLYKDQSRYKSGSYERAGAWKGKYRGGKRRYSRRDRGSSSLFSYEREQSRSPSPIPSYRTHTSDHVKLGCSVPGFDSSLMNEVYEPHDHASFRYTRSGDSQERPSSQLSDYSSQSGAREESAERSLSQASYGSRESISEGRRLVLLSEGYSSNKLKHKKRHESDSDDASSRERDPNQRSKYSDWYSRRRSEHRSKKVSEQLTDKSSESDSKDRDREDRDRWHYHSRRSRESPRKSIEHGDESRRQRYEPSRNGVCMSPKTEVDASSVQSQVTQGDDFQVTGEARADETVSQIQPMELVTSESSSPEPEGCIRRSKSALIVKKENEPETQAEQNQCPKPTLDAQVSNQFDNCQYDPHDQAVAAPSSPVHRVFDFERDETPPAEIVEATAEWYRTQNIPPNFDSISLQHVFQYYQNSVAGGSHKIEDGSLWPATQSQLGQEQQQEQTAATDSACSSATPIGNQCSQPYATSTEANANVSDDKSIHLPQLEASPLKSTDKDYHESPIAIYSNIQQQVEASSDKSMSELYLPEEGSIHSVSSENIVHYGHSPSSAYEHKAPVMNTRVGDYRSGIGYEGTDASMEFEEGWKTGNVQFHKSEQLHVRTIKVSREDIATHFAVSSGPNPSHADSPVHQPGHGGTLRLHSGYSDQTYWDCSSKNDQTSCEGPNLTSDGYPQEGVNMTDTTIPAFPSRIDKDVSDGEAPVSTIQCELDGWLQNVTDEDIPTRQGNGTSKTSQTFAVETKSTRECNSDTVTSTQTSALGESIETMEIQTVPLRQQQVCEYKYFQKSYYKEFCEQASILTESTKLLLSQNPGNKDVLMASLQLSLQKLSLHFKDKFWYQVELGEESSAT